MDKELWEIGLRRDEEESLGGVLGFVNLPNGGALACWVAKAHREVELEHATTVVALLSLLQHASRPPPPDRRRRFIRTR